MIDNEFVISDLLIIVDKVNKELRRIIDLDCNFAAN